VNSYISRAMTVCSSACSSSSPGLSASAQVGTPSLPQRWTPIPDLCRIGRPSRDYADRAEPAATRH
jgi:hypothetical protein